MEENKGVLMLYRYLGGGGLKIGGLGGVLGFDWAAVKIVADGVGVNLDRDTIDCLKIIEGEVMKHFAKEGKNGTAGR